MRVGLAADHSGFEMKQQLAKLIAAEGHEIADFGSSVYDANDDYPDFTIPLAHAVSRRDVERGVLLCGSGLGASVTANKIFGVRAALCHDDVSARQGVEDDGLNLLCYDDRAAGLAAAWNCIKVFLSAKLSGAERPRRRLAKIAKLEAAWMPMVSTRGKSAYRINK